MAVVILFTVNIFDTNRLLMIADKLDAEVKARSGSQETGGANPSGDSTHRSSQAS